MFMCCAPSFSFCPLFAYSHPSTGGHPLFPPPLPLQHPGACKELQYQEESVQYLEDALVNGTRSNPGSMGFMRNSGVLAILKDMAR